MKSNPTSLRNPSAQPHHVLKSTQEVFAPPKDRTKTQGQMNRCSCSQGKPECSLPPPFPYIGRTHRDEAAVHQEGDLFAFVPIKPSKGRTMGGYTVYHRIIHPGSQAQNTNAGHLDKVKILLCHLSVLLLRGERNN